MRLVASSRVFHANRGPKMATLCVLVVLMAIIEQDFKQNRCVASSSRGAVAMSLSNVGAVVRRSESRELWGANQASSPAERENAEGEDEAEEEEGEGDDEEEEDENEKDDGKKKDNEVSAAADDEHDEGDKYKQPNGVVQRPPPQQLRAAANNAAPPQPQQPANQQQQQRPSLLNRILGRINPHSQGDRTTATAAAGAQGQHMQPESARLFKLGLLIG